MTLHISSCMSVHRELWGSQNSRGLRRGPWQLHGDKSLQMSICMYVDMETSMHEACGMCSDECRHVCIDMGMGIMVRILYENCLNLNAVSDRWQHVCRMHACAHIHIHVCTHVYTHVCTQVATIEDLKDELHGAPFFLPGVTVSTRL